MSNKPSKPHPTIREVVRLGDILWRAAQLHINDRQAKSHAAFVKALNEWWKISKAVREGSKSEQLTLFDPDGEE